MTVSSTKTDGRIGCCGIFLHELKISSIYSVDEANGKQIDLLRSFSAGGSGGRDNETSSNSSYVIITLKFLFAAMVVSTFCYEWYNNLYPLFWMSYISNWTMLYTCIYLSLSFIISFVAQPMTWIMHVTWILFLIVIDHGIMVTLLFWLTEYTNSYSEPTFPLVMFHGGAVLLALIDGFIINRIPIRLTHYIFVLFFGMLYCIWTVLQGLVFEIDNPWTSPQDDSEALYTLIDWKNDPTLAIIVGIGVNFVAFPLLTMIFWAISISSVRCPRRYITFLENDIDDNDNDDDNKKCNVMMDIEEP